MSSGSKLTKASALLFLSRWRAQHSKFCCIDGIMRLGRAAPLTPLSLTGVPLSPVYECSEFPKQLNLA